MAAGAGSAQYTGSVKHWREDRGFGFVTVEGLGDVYVHRTVLTDGQALEQGAQVSIVAGWDEAKGKYAASSCTGATAKAAGKGAKGGGIQISWDMGKGGGKDKGKGGDAWGQGKGGDAWGQGKGGDAWGQAKGGDAWGQGKGGDAWAPAKGGDAWGQGKGKDAWGQGKGSDGWGGDAGWGKGWGGDAGWGMEGGWGMGKGMDMGMGKGKMGMGKGKGAGGKGSDSYMPPQSAWVKAWNDERGFGFATTTSGQDVYVHRTVLTDGLMLLKGAEVWLDAYWNAEKSNWQAGMCSGSAPKGSGKGGKCGKPSAGTEAPVATGVQAGTVKAWNEKGFGFIVPENGGPDVFVHEKAISDAKVLTPGQLVVFDLQWNEKAGKYLAESCSTEGGDGASSYGKAASGGAGAVQSAPY
eukprot:TRINITY_DN638_c0_g1_i1.p1 TRINITY_DN638_c0_g1~~TRINITY_DN638_c0_g1_i1.p1  ORF type:complete len:409 (-),score=83.08 TRINITY_DN638_c0_g1_i1:212-1438(-)